MKTMLYLYTQNNVAEYSKLKKFYIRLNEVQCIYLESEECRYTYSDFFIYI